MEIKHVHKDQLKSGEYNRDTDFNNGAIYNPKFCKTHAHTKKKKDPAHP